MTTVNKALRPYYDDYNEQKNYYEILFRPSVAVQTRELNQIQSMFYKQVERFGSHVFKNGSVVIPGSLNYDNEFQYVKLTVNDYDNVIDTLKQTLNLRIVTPDDGVIANVILLVDSEGTDPFTLYVRYTNSGSTNDIQQFVVGLTATIVDQDDNVLATATVDEVGTGAKATVDNGVYFINGRFVLVAEHTILISKYSSFPNASVGFQYDEVIVTENEDQSLVDNAAGFTNFTAPGAHRLRVDVSLATYPLDTEYPDNYVELLQVEEGLARQFARGPQYNILAQSLSQRTYEESGDYTVKPFATDTTEHLLVPNSGIDGYLLAVNGGDESKYVVSIDPGLAYVRGYRVESLKTQYLEVDKARESAIANNSTSIVNYGQYIIVENAYGAPIVTDNQRIQFYDGAVTVPGSLPAGTLLGSANVRSIIRNTSDVELYIYNIRNTSGALDSTFLATAQSVYSASGTSTFTAELATKFVLETESSSAIVRLNFSNVKTLLDGSGNTDTSYTVLRKYNSTIDSNGEVLLTCGTNESFIAYNDTYSYAIDVSNGALLDVLDATIGGSPTGSNLTLDFGAGKAGTNATVIVQVQKQQALQRSKSLVNDTVVGTVDVSKILSLGKTDAYDIVSIIDNASNDVTDKFVLDSNARTNYYGISFIREIDGGVVYPITVQFRYFQHGSGDYYSVDSYVGINYKDIPTFDGVRLSDCLDFRPDVDTLGNIVSSNDIAHTNSLIGADVTYYLPRIDKVFVNTEGVFGVVKGMPSLNPKEPNTPENSIDLARIYLDAYTIDANTVDRVMTDNKRFTMSDIGLLKNRIENLEYYVSLSLLEQQTANVELYDETTGLNRFKNGFFVDPFEDHRLGDWTWQDYHVATGLMGSANALRPEYSLNAIETKVNESASSNIVIKNGLAMLQYTEIPFIKQRQATSTINVNPYAIFKWDGKIDLTPSVDNWIDVVYSEPRVNYTLINNGNIQQSWTAFGLSWVAGSTSSSSINTQTLGSSVIGSDTVVIASTRRSETLRTTTTIADSQLVNVNLTNTQTTVNEIADHLISRSIIPFMRSRDVVIDIDGMKPLTKMNFFFDGVNVNQWVKPLPSGAYGSAVVTNNQGEASAVFTIPNNAQQRFKVGSRVLEVTDSPTNNRQESQAFADAEYVAEGILENRMKELNATRSVNTSTSSFVSSSIRTQVSDQQVTWGDPLAQSFLIEQRGGVFLTSIELYFAEKDNENIPVSVDIRAMENGFPTQNIVPGSEVMLKPSQVLTSNNSSVATKFEFKYPIHLKQGHEYCFVIHSNSNKYYVWKSTMSEVDVLTNEVITKQPYIGVMFKSQNSSTWTEDQWSDLKFALNRASFNINSAGLLALENTDQQQVIPLTNNPIQTYASQTYVDVLIPKGHTFLVGSNVTLAGLTGGNGLVANDLNKTHVVSDIISPAVIRIDTGVSATATSRIGGLDGTRTNVVQYSALFPNVEVLTFDSTNVTYQVKPTSGQSFSGSEVAYQTSLPYTPFVNKALNFFNQPMVVLDSDEETSKTLGQKTFGVRFGMSSQLENISPVIDLQRCTFVSPLFLIDREGSIQADGENSYAKYRTIPISIDNPTTAVSMYVDEYVPNNSEIVYSIRVANSKEELDEAPWQLLNTSTTRVSVFFEEANFLKEFTEDFTWVQVMIQLRSNSTADVPKVRNLRVIALGT